MSRLRLFSILLLVFSTHIALSEEKGEALLQDGAVASNQQYEYRLLATSKTSTMQKEMDEAGRAGFRIAGVMGGETAFGGSEVVVVMSRDQENPNEGDYQYKLLATSKTSTMQKELQEAGDEGFEYRGQTVLRCLKLNLADKRSCLFWSVTAKIHPHTTNTSSWPPVKPQPCRRN
jgi:hypothetical protein